MPQGIGRLTKLFGTGDAGEAGEARRLEDVLDGVPQHAVPVCLGGCGGEVSGRGGVCGPERRECDVQRLKVRRPLVPSRHGEEVATGDGGIERRHGGGWG